MITAHNESAQPSTTVISEPCRAWPSRHGKNGRVRPTLKKAGYILATKKKPRRCRERRLLEVMAECRPGTVSPARALRMIPGPARQHHLALGAGGSSPESLSTFRIIDPRQR
jgi:hypothetical protein